MPSMLVRCHWLDAAAYNTPQTLDLDIARKTATLITAARYHFAPSPSWPYELDIHDEFRFRIPIFRYRVMTGDDFTHDLTLAWMG